MRASVRPATVLAVPGGLVTRALLHAVVTRSSRAVTRDDRRLGRSVGRGLSAQGSRKSCPCWT